MRKNIARIACAFLIGTVCMISGCAKEEKEPMQAIRSFSDWTDIEVFQKVPAMVVEGTKVMDARDAGRGAYMVDVLGTNLEDYKAYLELLQQAGFEKYSDTGEEGFKGFVYNSTFTKGDLCVSVTQTIKNEKTYIMVTDQEKFSPNLVYDEKRLEDNKPGAKTTMTSMEMCSHGTGIIFQLKNGHFIINDGGTEPDLGPLLDYLESLTPNGEKPVIEAWFISHAHPDHQGLLEGFLEHLDWIDRIVVDAFYFMELNSDSGQMIGGNGLFSKFAINATYLKDSNGDMPVIYRPEIGQRYYFSDISVDVCFSADILPSSSFIENGFNDSSTWLTYNVEGQEFMIPGDASYSSQQAVMGIYDSEYFDMELGASFHHGINTYNFFTEYCKFKTVVYTSYRLGSIYEEKSMKRESENKILVDSVKEAVAWGKGGNVFTFPYEVGSVEFLPMIDWAKYGLTDPSDFHELRGIRVQDFENYIVNE